MALYIKEENTADKLKQATAIYKGTESGPRVVSAVYQGLMLIWQYVKSCFGRGYWINDKMWSDKDAWKNRI